MTETGNRIDVESTNAGAVAEAITPVNSSAIQLLDVNIKFNLAPTASEDIVINATTPGGFVKELFTIDPSDPSTTNVRWVPEGRQRFSAGTTISIAYTNTDARTVTTSLGYQVDQSVV